MKATRAIAALPVVLVAAACGGESLQASPSHNAAIAAAPVTHARVAAPGKTGPCRSSELALHLGQPGGAAGSRYQAIVFTNTSATTCTLDGYPGVSFVAPHSGAQVGAAASRNPQHAATTVAIAPGRSASALLQIANHENFPPADCKATAVSGLRVYPPGEKAAVYVPFDGAQSACSSQVGQLSVDAVVAGAGG